MKRVLSIAVIGMLLSAPSLNAQPKNDDDLLDLKALEGPRTEMGWNIIPESVTDKPAEELSELERLSLSPSGINFGLEAYDARIDNPLVPISVTLRALDKITATYQDIEIDIGQQAEFGPLVLLPRTCDKRPPEETPETTVFLEVYADESDVSLQRVRASLEEELPSQSSAIILPGEDAAAVQDDVSGTALFKGWMFASSPSLNAMEHPVYDVWVIDCKMVDPSI